MFFQENHLGFFVIVSSAVFMSPLILLLFWGVSLLITFIHFITVFSGCFVSPLVLLLFFECSHFSKFLYRDCFLSGTSFLRCCTRVLRIWESFFHFSAFFTSHSFLAFGTNCFYQGFPGKSFSALKVAWSSVGSKHRPGPSVCLNHILFSKRY